MFDSIRESVIKSDVQTARQANRTLVRIIKRGWGSGLMADQARAARNAAMSNARRIKEKK